MEGLEELEKQRSELERASPSSQRRGESVRGFDLMSVDHCETFAEDSRPPESPADSAGRVDGGRADVKGGVGGVGAGNGKKRRGRPPRSRAKLMPPPAPPPKKKKEEEEEDVCFICFDGGNLVLCDRRGCPKAYHPACVKRDESFFQSKARWNCGWHICNSCKRPSYNMCYTCQYSVCKGCVKGADYVAVRGSKGFCGVCMRTILLIEDAVQEERERIQVDFDDKSSWEYLFKIYWVHLKGKLSLSIDELVRAKSSWKGNSRDCPKRELCDCSDGRVCCSGNSCKCLMGDHAKRQRSKVGSISVEKLFPSTNICGRKYQDGGKWATEELLEFVAHMKNGAKSAVSEYDIQTLLLEYVTRNNLHDPLQKNQVICDSRLLSLFRKERVGHFEMLKLLKSHFLVRENSVAVSNVRGGLNEAFSLQKEAVRNQDLQIRESGERDRIHKSTFDGELLGSDEYAAINIHNINLIYLKRNLMENLINDTDKYHDKVIGLIVRIRIPGDDQGSEAHRLVQVVGTCRAAKPYIVGSKTTDVMLEILNLDKEEVISVDAISSQDFTEDECRRLRQSMKCGLNKRLKVGDVREKAMVLHEVRINNELKAEISRLNQLCDRASEKGRNKEECVERLEVLKSPEERYNRFQAIPEIHPDPSMDPSYGSELNVKTNQDENTRAQSSDLSRKETESPRLDTPSHVVDPRMSHQNKGTVGKSLPLAVFSGGLAESPIPRVEKSHDDLEMRRIWHYQDPSGKIQGPFSMMHLRKWSTNGHFPPDLRVWRTNENKDNSVLLTDALSQHLATRKERSCPTGIDHNAFGSRWLSENASQVDDRLRASLNSPCTDVSAISSDNSTITGSSVASSKCGNSLSHIIPADFANSGVAEKSSYLMTGQPTVICSLSLHASHGNACQTPHDAREGPGFGIWNFAESNANENSVKNLNGGNNSGNLAEDCGQNWKVLHESNASAVWDPGFLALGSSFNTSNVDQEIDFPDFPGPGASFIPKESRENHTLGDWQAIIPGPDECEESVSDLLAEVEAMESLKALSSSPASNLQCGMELSQGPQNDCCSPVEGQSPATFETSKSDAVSSSNDLPMPSR